MNRSVWRQVRFSLYAAFVINGILVQWVLPLQYRCNLTGEQCFACGLRTAVNLALRGQLVQAYESNPLILPVLIALLAMAVDVWIALFGRKRRHKVA